MRVSKLWRVIKAIAVIALFYYGLQCILGLVLWKQLHELVRAVGGDRAGYLVGRVDALTGRVILNGVRADGWLFTDSLRARTVVVSIRYQDLKAGKRQIKRVTIKHPVFSYDLSQPKQEGAQAGSEGELPTPYLVEEIRIRAGELVFSDPPAKNFELALVGIEGTIRDLTNTVSLVEERSRIELAGRVKYDRMARWEVWGSFNPRFPKAYFHLNLKTEDFPLPLFEPYGSEAYFERGLLDYELRAVCENYRLQAANTASLREIKIKERKFTLRKLIGLTADRISENINKKHGGFKVQFKVADSMRREMKDVFLSLVLKMTEECQKEIKSQAGDTFKSNLKGIFF